MHNDSSTDGVELPKKSLAYLLQHMSIGSWIWMLGLFGGVFLIGYQTPTFLRVAQPSELLSQEQSKRRDLEQEIIALKGEVATKSTQISTLIKDGNEEQGKRRILEQENEALKDDIETKAAQITSLIEAAEEDQDKARTDLTSLTEVSEAKTKRIESLVEDLVERDLKIQEIGPLRAALDKVEKRLASVVVRNVYQGDRHVHFPNSHHVACIGQSGDNGPGHKVRQVDFQAACPSDTIAKDFQEIGVAGGGQCDHTLYSGICIPE